MLPPVSRGNASRGSDSAASAVPSADFGFKSSAQSAGLRVSELNAEISVPTAMVTANCR